MVNWKLLISGLTAQGEHKKYYDKARRSRPQHKAKEAIRRRRKYTSDPELRARILEVNKNARERWIEKYGIEAWRARNREYKRQYKLRLMEKATENA